MKNNLPDPKLEKPGAPSEGPARKSVLLLAAAVGLGAVGLVAVASKSLKSGELKTVTDAPVADMPVAEIPEAQPVAESVSAPANLPSIATPDPEPDHAAIARQLIKGLSEIDTRPGALTPEKAEKWHRELEQLIEQGTAVVPPLQEFFESHADVKFNAGSGTNLLAEPSLRIAFLKVLFDVPAPDNVYLQEEVLRTTTDPAEIVVLARQLEAQEPGKYRDLIVSTARLSLSQVRGGQWAGTDPDSLIKILRQYGDSSAK